MRLCLQEVSEQLAPLPPEDAEIRDTIMRIREEKRRAAEEAEAIRLAEERREAGLVAHVGVDVLDNGSVTVRVAQKAAAPPPVDESAFADAPSRSKTADAPSEASATPTAVPKVSSAASSACTQQIIIALNCRMGLDIQFSGSIR